MAIMINCAIKGCGKYMTPLLSSDGKVYCDICGEAQPNTNHFLKTQLKAIGQTKKAAPSAYAIACKKCKINTLPAVNQNNQLICPSCQTQHQSISKPFELLIREAIKKGKQED